MGKYEYGFVGAAEAWPVQEAIPGIERRLIAVLLEAGERGKRKVEESLGAISIQPETQLTLFDASSF